MISKVRHSGRQFARILAWGAPLTALAAMAAAAVSAPAHAGGKPASFVVDANTGAVISAYNADEPRFPASLTKMMTLYVTFDLIEQGRLSYQTRIKVSDTAAGAPPSKLGLEAGSDIALIDAIKALITRSANDIAIAVAEHIAGTEEKFAALMTQRARAIGMKASTFRNASGLPNESQVTTARDMVTLGLRLHDDFPKHYALFAMREFRYEGKAHPNHNTMLNSYEGTEGIKTGYTQASGFNLVASVKRNAKHVVGAVFGGASAASRNQTMRTLLNLALFKASNSKTRASSVAVARARPAPEPKPEARPPVIAAKSTPAPTGWAPQVVAELKAPPNPVVTAVQATSPPASDKIEIARVRPVLVAPRQPRQAPVAVATTPTVMGNSTAEPSPPQAPPDFKLPPLASTATATEPALTQPRQGPIAAKAVAQARPIVVASAAADAGQVATKARGAPPSSLQHQAANLAGGTPTQAYHLSGPAVGVASGGFEIQIGAFSSAAEAERQIAVARGKAADLIGSAPGTTHPVTANGKPVWRARFGGFQSASATSVCSELRRRQIDCLVAKAE